MIFYSDVLKWCPLDVVNFVAKQYAEHRMQYPFVIDFLTGREKTLFMRESVSKFAVPVAAMLWSPRDNGAIWWVEFVCVAKDNQAQGRYLALREELVKRAKADPVCRRIQSHVSPHNSRMMDLMERVGSKIIFHTYDFDVRA